MAKRRVDVCGRERDVCEVHSVVVEEVLSVGRDRHVNRAGGVWRGVTDNVSRVDVGGMDNIITEAAL